MLEGRRSKDSGRGSSCSKVDSASSPSTDVCCSSTDSECRSSCAVSSIGRGSSLGFYHQQHLLPALTVLQVDPWAADSACTSLSSSPSLFGCRLSNSTSPVHSHQLQLDRMFASANNSAPAKKSTLKLTPGPPPAPSRSSSRIGGSRPLEIPACLVDLPVCIIFKN